MKQFNLAAVVVTMVAFCLVAFPALAQDAVKVDPSTTRWNLRMRKPEY